MTFHQIVALPSRNEGVQTEQGSLQFIGTATVLLRYAGFTLLTDPNFLHQGDHVHLGYGLKSKRLTNPALNLDELPPLDLIILSHLHEDHFDRLVERRFTKTVPIITTHAAAIALRKKGFIRTYPLNTWDTLSVYREPHQLDITAMPAQHGPGIVSRLLPSVMGSMLEFKAREKNILYRLYITGDTVLFKDLKAIPQRYPDIDAALLHLGGTRIFGLVLTMDAKRGIKAIKTVHPHTSIPIHYNDYTVFKSPLADFQQAVSDAGLDKQVHYLKHGEVFRFEVPASRR